MKTNELYIEVEKLGLKLQSYYFEHERFFDNIKGADSLDNVSGWLYELEGVVDGSYTGAKATEFLQWVYSNFCYISNIMERNGAGANGAARGIREEKQYVWALSRHASSLVSDIAKEMNIKL